LLHLLTAIFGCRVTILSPTERISFRFFERLSARVRVKRSSVLAMPSHASCGACCHCQYPQSRNDQRVPTRADGGSAILTESILFDEPRAGYIKGFESVPPLRFRPWRCRGDRIITRQDALNVTFCRNHILWNWNNCREHSINTVHSEEIDQFIVSLSQYWQTDKENDIYDLFYIFIDIYSFYIFSL